MVTYRVFMTSDPRDYFNVGPNNLFKRLRVTTEGLYLYTDKMGTLYPWHKISFIEIYNAKEN